jgi:RNA-directed DNA polymerase
VIAPLLASIYLHLFDREFLSYCRATGLRAHLVPYADDFVIVMRGGMKGTVNQVRQVLVRMELKLNEEKNRVVDAREGSFDFLGLPFVLTC